MKNILFLHPNFPGQFKYISRAFAEAGHEVSFLCQTHYGRSIKNVQRLTIKKENLNNPGENEITTTADTYSNGRLYRKALKDLSKTYTPDIIISHSGFGCGLHCKDIWPKATLIAYIEWWFRSDSDLFEFDKGKNFMGFTEESIEKFKVRNCTTASEICDADYLVAPTMWQRNQLPKNIRSKCSIIFDGVDTKYIKSKHKPRQDSKELTLTYGTRGMEAVRCFPQFIEELPSLLRNYQNLKVQIAGEDKINYGGLKPHKHKSWKSWAVEFLREHKIEHKVEWMGRMPFEKYIEWLCSSNIHVYLSHPFVPSWSFIEAQSAGCNLICTDHKSLRENVFTDSIMYVNHNKKGFLLDAVDMLGLKVDSFINSNTAAVNPLQALDYDVSTAVRKWLRVTGVDVTTQA